MTRSFEHREELPTLGEPGCAGAQGGRWSGFRVVNKYLKEYCNN